MRIRPVGNRRLYRANADGLTEMGQFIDDMWSDGLTKLKAAAEQAEQARSQDGQAKRSTP